jgi:ABC-2 type transport system ATP-binding protein
MDLTDSARPPVTTSRPSPGGPPEVDLVVSTTGLTKGFGPRTAVDGLDLAIPRGVLSGFVGPNGAGKTTTIRMLLGLLRPSQGSGVVLGHDIGDPLAALQGVGAMIEGPTFHAALTGRANLRSLALLGGIPGARVDEVLERVGLSGRGDDRFGSYSLSMKQRLGIAAALLPDPTLLVLDEPTNGLDPAGIVEMRGLLRSLVGDGRTVFVSTHLLAEVEQVCDHLVMIDQGRLVYQGTLRDLRSAAHPVLTLRPLDADGLPRLRALLDARGWGSQRTGDDLVVHLPEDATDPSGDLAAGWLNDRAHQEGVTLSRLSVSRPSLEQTFFHLTGDHTDETSGDPR